MTARRSYGEGSLYWDEDRQRWIANLTVGYTPDGKRIRRRASGRTKTEARAKLKQLVRDHDEGLATSERGYTVAQAVTDWLDYGLTGRGHAPSPPDAVSRHSTSSRPWARGSSSSSRRTMSIAGWPRRPARCPPAPSRI